MSRACVWWHLLSLPKASSPAKRLAIGDAHLAGSWLARRPQRSGLQRAAQRVPRYPLRMRAVVGVVHNFPLLPNTKFSDSVVKSVFTRYYSHGIRTSPGSPAGYHDGRPGPPAKGLDEVCAWLHKAALTPFTGPPVTKLSRTTVTERTRLGRELNCDKVQSGYTTPTALRPGLSYCLLGNKSKRPRPIPNKAFSHVLSRGGGGGGHTRLRYSFFLVCSKQKQ